MYRKGESGWVLESRLEADDAAEGDCFGIALDLEGGRCVVGAPWKESTSTRGGAVYVYELEGAAWVQRARLGPPAGPGGEYFGCAVSTAGERLLVGARFADGPVALIAGGPFRSCELVSGPEPDWSFVRDVQEVEFQLLAPARSRTTWILYHEGRAYIPCGYMTTWWGKIWKQWPHEAEKDPRILLRIGDSIYERQLVRIEEGPEVEPLLAELSRKYAGGSEIPLGAVSSGYLWIYELAPRS